MRQQTRTVLIGALSVIALLASACATLPPVMGGTPNPAATSAPTTGDPTVTPPVPGERIAAVTEIAKQALAQELGVPVENIRVLSSGQVDWPNGCLGIAKPGVMCTDAIVPGYQIILEVDGKQYEVRTSLNGGTVAIAPEGITRGNEFPSAAQLARGQAAADLGMELGQITIVSAEPAEWPDACLGQPDPTELCAQMITPGYRVTLDANGTEVVYRTDESGQSIRRERQPQSADEFPAAAQAARDALAQELGVAADTITIQQAEAAEWTDSCLGLGGAAESCLQAITPGYRVFLEREGEQFIYRTDETGQSVRREPAGPAGGEFPAAAQAARDALAQLLGVPADQITIQSAEPMEWSDGCLGLGGPVELCLQAITPGYRVTLQAGGKQYVYRTDETGQAVRAETAATGSAGQTGAGASEPVITLSRDVDGACQDTRVDAQGVSFGACGMDMANAPFAGNAARLAQLEEMRQLFASFSASTPAGKVTFAGQGPIPAAASEQRMIAEWANLVGQEAQAGADGAGYGLGWKREGGIAGFCDELSVDASGHATLRSCKDQAAAETWTRLTADELTAFYGWLDRFSAAEAQVKDPAVADAMTVSLIFSGRGSGQASQADTDAMMQLANELLQQWAKATPVRYITTSAEVNIRQGPGETFDVVEKIAAGQQALVTGASRDDAWWRVVCPDTTAGHCWVTADAQYTQAVPPADSADQTATDEAAILAAVIRQVYTVDDTAGGNGKFPIVYLLTVEDNALGAIPYNSPARSVPAETQQAVLSALSDLPAQFKWVESAGEVKRNAQGAVEGNGAIITVGNVQPQSDGTVHVTASIYFAPMGAGGQTYVLEREGDAWQVTGKVGVSWIS